MRGVILAFLIISLLFVFCKDTFFEPHGGKATIIHDTIIVVKPEVRDSLVVRYVTNFLPIAKTDTVIKSDTIVDSVQVVIPITQKVYSDSTYRAVISGYNANLDSMEVYRKTTIIERKSKPKKWNVSSGIGVGIDTDGKVKPFIGISIGYTLKSF